MGNNNKQVDKFCWVIGFLTVIIALAIFRSTPPDPYKLDKYFVYFVLIAIYMTTTRDYLKDIEKLSFRKVFKASSASLLANGTFYLGLLFYYSYLSHKSPISFNSPCLLFVLSVS